MQPNILTNNNTNFRIFTDENNHNFPAAGIQTYALRRVFSLAVGTPKTVDFADLQGFWDIDSIYISSPADSEVTVEILNDQGVPFYSELYARNSTPRTMPTVLVNNTLTMKLTAARSPIGLLLIYLKPAHLAYSKDF